jgi:hypothetical protein
MKIKVVCKQCGGEKPKRKSDKMKNEFIRGIAEALNCDAIEAEAQWGGYSRQLDDDAIRKIESEGYARGVQIGREIASL